MSAVTGGTKELRELQRKFKPGYTLCADGSLYFITDPDGEQVRLPDGRKLTLPMSVKPSPVTVSRLIRAGVLWPPESHVHPIKGQRGLPVERKKEKEHEAAQRQRLTPPPGWAYFSTCCGVELEVWELPNGRSLVCPSCGRTVGKSFPLRRETG